MAHCPSKVSIAVPGSLVCLGLIWGTQLCSVLFHRDLPVSLPERREVDLKTSVREPVEFPTTSTRRAVKSVRQIGEVLIQRLRGKVVAFGFCRIVFTSLILFNVSSNINNHIKKSY